MLYCSTTRMKGNWTKQNILKYQTLYNHDTKGMSLMYKKHWIFPMIKMLSFTFMYRRVHSSKLDHLRQITFLRPLFYKCSIGLVSEHWTTNPPRNADSIYWIYYILPAGWPAVVRILVPLLQVLQVFLVWISSFLCSSVQPILVVLVAISSGILQWRN